MANLEKLEARLDTALDALARGGGSDAAAMSERVGELEKALEAATQAAEQSRSALVEAEKELEALREETQAQDQLDEEDITALNRQIENLSRAQSDAFEDRRRAKQYNQHLRKLNASLRKANEENLANPELINKSLETELEQLSASRDRDLQEINDILARLQPLVEGSEDG